MHSRCGRSHQDTKVQKTPTGANEREDWTGPRWQTEGGAPGGEEQGRVAVLVLEVHLHLKHMGLSSLDPPQLYFVLRLQTLLPCMSHLRISEQVIYGEGVALFDNAHQL